MRAIKLSAVAYWMTVIVACVGGVASYQLYQHRHSLTLAQFVIAGAPWLSSCSTLSGSGRVIRSTGNYRRPPLRHYLLVLLAAVLGLVAVDLYYRMASYRPEWLLGLILLTPASSVILYRFVADLGKLEGEAQQQTQSLPNH